MVLCRFWLGKTHPAWTSWSGWIPESFWSLGSGGFQRAWCFQLCKLHCPCSDAAGEVKPLSDSFHLRKVFWGKSSWFRSLPVPALPQSVPCCGFRVGDTRAVPVPVCAGCEQTLTGLVPLGNSSGTPRLQSQHSWLCFSIPSHFSGIWSRTMAEHLTRHCFLLKYPFYGGEVDQLS